MVTEILLDYCASDEVYTLNAEFVTKINLLAYTDLFYHGHLSKTKKNVSIIFISMNNFCQYRKENKVRL